MRPLLTSAFVSAVVLAVLPAIPQRAEAGTGVLRCQMPDGSAAYTSKSCSAFGAKTSPLPADVMGRIARDQRRAAKLAALQSGVDAGNAWPNQFDDAHATMLVPARRPLVRGCATTPQQLAQDLQGSIALGDVNRIAESFDWAGMGNEQGQRIMTRLQQIAHRRIRDAEYFDASIGDGMLFADAANDGFRGAAGTLQVTFDAGNGDSIVHFNVRRDQGCYFLRY